nr:hypothetical protein [Gammaproteobacteria bacterium]
LLAEFTRIEAYLVSLSPRDTNHKVPSDFAQSTFDEADALAQRMVARPVGWRTDPSRRRMARR